MIEGGCQCGAVRYQVSGKPVYHALCHCDDCRASSGAPMVAWFAVKADQLEVTSGAPSAYEGASGSQRQFCPACGTGLFFRNEKTLPGLVDIQSATFDDPSAHAPQIQVQCAERVAWMSQVPEMPEFERYPGPVG